MSDVLEVYTVYKDIPGYPDWYVVRKQSIAKGGDIHDHPVLFMASKNIDRIRAMMIGKMGLVMIPRDEGDAPGIVETYM